MRYWKFQLWDGNDVVHTEGGFESEFDAELHGKMLVRKHDELKNAIVRTLPEREVENGV